MQIRRLTRLTDGHSKKWENHEAAIALFFAWHNQDDASTGGWADDGNMGLGSVAQESSGSINQADEWPC